MVKLTVHLGLRLVLDVGFRSRVRVMSKTSIRFRARFNDRVNARVRIIVRASGIAGLDSGLGKR